MKFTKRDEHEYEAFHYRGLQDLDGLKRFVPELYRSVYNEGLVNARPQIVIITGHGPIALRDSEYVVKNQDGTLAIYSADAFARLFTQVVVEGEHVAVSVDSVGAAAAAQEAPEAPAEDQFPIGTRNTLDSEPEEDDPIARAVRAVEKDKR